MPKLIFIKRTPKEIEIFGGDVYFDIDGKNVGKLSLDNQEVLLEPGEHRIKMYKSHTFDTFIGFAESTIVMQKGDNLMIKYSAPMMISQPGNIVISEYSEESLEETVIEKERTINRDFIEVEKEKKEAEDKYKHGVSVVIWVSVAIAVIFGIYYGSF